VEGIRQFDQRRNPQILFAEFDGRSKRPGKMATIRQVLLLRPSTQSLRPPINLRHYQLRPTNRVCYRDNRSRHPRATFVRCQLAGGQNTGGDQQYTLSSFFHPGMIYFRYMFAKCDWRALLAVRRQGTESAALYCAKQCASETCGNPECKADLKKVKSPLAGLRFHDLRHHAITELAESQASDRTVMAIAGHVSPKMLAHYSHVRIRAKRTALDSLSTKQAERVNSGGESRGYDTNHDTKRGPDERAPPQVLENMVELVGIEPTTSSLRTMRSPS
jgi:hypothetical protein